MERKKCKGCNKIKLLSEYYSPPSWKGNVWGKCKSCIKEYIKQWQKTPKGRRGLWSQYQKNSARGVYARYRQTEGYKKRHREANAKYNRLNKEKRHAHSLARHAIPLLDYCEGCGTRDVRLHRHHPDYSKPLEVRILCVSCHEREHHPYNHG